jgi:DNA-binding NarL/FixJ family response regulator
LLESEGEFEVVAEASDGREGIELALEKRPDVVLMDVGLPGLSGVEATRQIVQARPECKVLIVSEYDRPNFVQAALKEGALGYVLKTATPEELLAAVRAVLEGKCYLSPDIAHHVVGRFSDPNRESSALDSLTHREREVLQLIAEGLSSKEIASQLCISTRTVDAHRSSLMTKIGSHKAAGLVRFAIREGLVTP